jgi:hypothetical protein
VDIRLMKILLIYLYIFFLKKYQIKKTCFYKKYVGFDTKFIRVLLGLGIDIASLAVGLCSTLGSGTLGTSAC